MNGSRNSSFGNNDKHRIPDQTLEQIQRSIEQLCTKLGDLMKQRMPPGTEALTASACTGPNLGASPTVPRIVEELLVAKASDGLSSRYIETIRSHLRRFGKGFKTQIGAITTSQIERWLRNQNVGPRARNNFRGSIVTLFRFAQKQGYLTKGQPTEADDVAKAKDYGGEVGILTAEQLAHILSHAPERSCLFLVLGAFTGMRSSEILRLDWSDINLDRKFITVAAHKAKTATRRLVPIVPNLMAWLNKYRGRTGALFRTRRDADYAIAFAKACEVKWPNNALRHSYATYRLAETANAAQVALEMGNSPQKLMTNYRELADESEAKAWFGIFPASLQPENAQ
jgi:integrase